MRAVWLSLIFLFGFSAHAALPIEAILDVAYTNRDPHDDDFESAWLLTSALADEIRPVYTVNEARHGRNATGNPAASKLPANAESLYGETLPFRDGSGRITWWAVENRDERCVYHRYQGTNGEVHWNGASRRLGGGMMIRMGDIPRTVRTLLSAYARCRNT